MGTKLAWMQRCASPQGQLTMVKSFLNLKYKCTQTCYFMQTLNSKNLSFPSSFYCSVPHLDLNMFKININFSGFFVPNLCNGSKPIS